MLRSGSQAATKWGTQLDTAFRQRNNDGTWPNGDRSSPRLTVTIVLSSMRFGGGAAMQWVPEVIVRSIGALVGVSIVYMGARLLHVGMYDKAQELRRLTKYPNVQWRQWWPGLLFLIVGVAFVVSSLILPAWTFWRVESHNLLQDTDAHTERSGRAEIDDQPNKGSKTRASEDSKCDNTAAQGAAILGKKSKINSTTHATGTSSNGAPFERASLKIQAGSAVVATMTLILGLFGIRWEIVRWMAEQRRRYYAERADRTEALSREWNETILRNHKVIEENGFPDEIDKSDAWHIAYSTPSIRAEDKRLYATKAAVISLMNIFEGLVILYDSKLIDTALVDRTMARAVTERYKNIRHVVVELEEKAKALRWAPVHQVVKDWDDQKPWLYFDLHSDDSSLERVQKLHEEARNLHWQQVRRPSAAP